jgi:hypothetical protein
MPRYPGDLLARTALLSLFACTNSPVTASERIDLKLSAQPARVYKGDTFELVWNASGAESCEATRSWSGKRPSTGRRTVGPLDENTTFGLSCQTPKGSLAISLVTVAVVDPYLRWQAPTENVDGTRLNDLAAFRIYWGAEPGEYSDKVTIGDPAASRWRIKARPGTYYFAMTAIDRRGNESALSNEIVRILP